ncbi:MAG: hypothetical protein IKG47_11145 [Oscillospiraceae bacterium]|nr:hypothetical protein [Oscillospiraceae bacterium]
MDQDMNSYLEQLRARTEKRLQNETNTNETAPVTTEATPSKVIDEEVKPSSLSVDEIVKEADTLRYELPNVSYDKESEKMMGDLMEWADREPTVPFEHVSTDSPSTNEDDKVPEVVENNTAETDTIVSNSDNLAEDIAEETVKKTFVRSKNNDDNQESVSKPKKQLSDREQKKRAKEFRRALVEKENGSGRGLIGEIFYVILFIILVILTILAVLYLLQTIAGIKILDVESVFDIVFGWITSKILH